MRMSGSHLWLLAFLAFVSLPSLADGAPLKVMSAPNLLQVGTAQNVFVECQDCSGGDIRVDISVMNHPTKTKKLAAAAVTLNAANNFQQFGQITIPAGDFSKDPKVKQYVYLQAQFPDELLEKVVLVSFQSGYIFIQTDKTIYTPNSRVHYRLFGVTPHLEPVEGGETDASITAEIVTPEGDILQFDSYNLKSGIHSGNYQLGQFVSPGLWKVVARFRISPQQSYSAEFEVKEHVLPSFDVKLTPESSFFYVDSPELIINIKATYQIGQEVDGVAYVLFGVIHNGHKKSIPSSLQRVMIENGDGAVTLRREHITQTFQNILDLVGSSIFVSVNVLTVTGGEMVRAELSGIQIVTSPYIIYFKRTPKYFKPGMSFDVSVEVVNPDTTPAQGVPVVVDPGALQGITAANGIARFTIDTMARDPSLLIKSRTNDPHILAERQAQATMLAQPYISNSNNYIHIGVETAELQLGDNLKIYLFFSKPSNENNDITYLIMSRGQLVKHGWYGRRQGQIFLSLIVPITKDMLPSFRIVAYYHTSDNEVVSDSVWVGVKETCMGSLKLEPSRSAPSYEPRKQFGLKVTGDPEATVGLVAVDKGVSILNNKHRLTQKKVWDVVEKFDTGCTPGSGKDSMAVFYDAGLLFESSTASGTPYRQELKCPVPSRRKRDTTTIDFTTNFNSDDIVSRTNFPESWLWSDIRLPACPRQTPDCKSTSQVKNFVLKDSLTTWQLIGISLSRSQGICVSDPLEVIVRKDFFIDLRLPYTAVVGNQIEVKAILHNYSPDSVTVLVDLIEKENLCSLASEQGKYRQEVKVWPQTTRSVPFIIIPKKYGESLIEVKAAVKDSSLSDAIEKTLRVVPEGAPLKTTYIVLLDPTTQGVDGKQVEIMNSNIPKVDLAPNTPTSTQIFITGRENVGALVENPISGVGMGGLIIQPLGSGEANIIRMTLPVIATTYLDKTNQWETVGFQKRSEALQHITRLTAYVVKVFAMATDLVSLEYSIICDAVKFLIINTQQPDGLFKEVGRVILKEMTGDVFGMDSDASMTAFCLIAMQESRSLCAASVFILQSSVAKAVTYLEKRLPQLTNPYAVAMTSYALANEGKLNREILYKFASPELTHWPVNKGHIYTMEATAYALLALVKVKAFEDARPVVRWFNQQQKIGGGYGSTQATIMVYQAVAEYWANVKEPEYDLNVNVLLPGRSKPERYNFNRKNRYTAKTIKFNDINHDVNVTASGTGEAILKMVSWYYSPHVERDCKKFNMLVELIPEVDDEEKIYRLRIEVLYKDRNNDATMSILDIGLLTGFTVNTNDLDALSKGRGRTIAKYDTNTDLSERGSLIIYLDKVSHQKTEEISFRIHQKLKVDVLQPAAVSVYEYDDQTHCVKFYHPEKKTGELLRLCRNNECICAAESCSRQKKGEISIDERLAKVCERTANSQTDFAYKVRMEEFTDDLSTDLYKMRVLEVIMEGTFDINPSGKLRTFLSFPHCRGLLDLQKGKTYLIMGTFRHGFKDEISQTYQYVLGGRTWIEYWPTEAECQTEIHKTTCEGIKDLDGQFSLFGCEY